MPTANGLYARAVISRPEAITLTEVLIDDEAIGQAQAGRQPYAARDDRGALIAECDHVLAQDARTCTGSADGDPVSVAHANEFCHRRAAEQGREPQLVAAGKKYPGRFLEAAQPSRLLAVAAGVEVHDRDLPGAQIPEELFVARTGLVHAARGGNDDDIGVVAAGDCNEALEDVAIVFLILGAADRHNPTACFAVGNFARH